MKSLLVTSLSLALASSALAEDRGQTVWMARCKGCHGVDGRAQTQIGAAQRISDFSASKWQKSFADQDIRQVVIDGSSSNPKMKPFGDKLSGEEIDAVVRYIRSLNAG